VRLPCGNGDTSPRATTSHECAIFDRVEKGAIDGQNAFILRGRTAEIDAAAGAFSRASNAGEGGVVLVLGPPGIGKTAILDALVAEAEERGFIVGRSKADEGDQIAPMAPLLLALRSGKEPLLSDAAFAELAPLRDQPVWLIDRIIGAMEERALQAPVLIVVDDVQWADRLTLSCIRIMPARLTGSPVVWLLAARDGSAHIDALMEARAQDSPRPHVVRLVGLDNASIEAIAHDRLGTPPSANVRQLLHEAAGNPFLAVSLLDGLGDANLTDDGYELPRRLKNGALRRLAPLSECALQFAQAGAVLGRPFALRDAAALLGISAPTDLRGAMDEAVRELVLQHDSGLLSFTHDLVRQAVYDGIAPSFRSELHRLVVTHLVENGASPLDAVPHVLASATFGDHASVSLLVQAAKSVASSLPAVAADIVLPALALLRENDPLWLDVGFTAFTILVDARRERDALVLANRLGRIVSDPERYAAIQAKAAWPLWSMGRAEEMLSRLDEACALEGISEILRAELVSLRALGGSRGEDYAAALAAGRSALDVSRSAGSEIAEATALRALAETSVSDGRFADALQYLRDIRSPAESLKTIRNQILLLQLLDRFDEAAVLLAHAQELVDRGAGILASDVAYARLWREYTAGDFDDGETEALTIIRECDEVHEDTYQVEARLLLGRIAQIQGRYADAERHIALTVADIAGGDETRIVLIAVVTSWLHESRGDYARALPLVREVMHPLRGVRHRWRNQPGWLVLAARCAVRSGDAGLAAEIESWAAGLAERNPDVATFAGSAEQIRGLVRGDVDALHRATKLLERSPRRYLFAYAEADYGLALLANGRRDEGVAMLDRAWERFHALGAMSDAERIQHALAGTGVRRVRKSKSLTGWDSLTATEQSVARLIFQGHTNRSAANVLALSSHTVNSHLRVIFGKFSVNSRVQLMRALMDRLSREEYSRPESSLV
jgi:DNA-binding CsgD family transcriptional regulator/tetratricopeptide (TPR) repeat protein